MPLTATTNEPPFNPVSRTDQAHIDRLQTILGMKTMEFRAFCYTAKLGPFSPPVTFAPQEATPAD